MNDNHAVNKVSMKIVVSATADGVTEKMDSLSVARQQNEDGDEEDNEDDEEDDEDNIVIPPELTTYRFKQISTTHDGTCGIEYDTGDLVCWGFPQIQAEFGEPSRNLDPPFDGRHVSGPFKQVSIGLAGACAITETDNKIQCWRNAGSFGHAAGSTWNQVKVADGSMCAVAMDSRLVCSGGSMIHKMPANFIVA